MSYRQKVIFIFIFLNVVTYGWSQSFMYIELTSGDVMYYKLKESPAIAYTDTDIAITTLGSHHSVPIKKIKNIQYQDSALQKFFIHIDESLTGPISVYNMNGVRITTIDKSDNINMFNIPYGVYILRDKESSQKILLQ